MLFRFICSQIDTLFLIINKHKRHSPRPSGSQRQVGRMWRAARDKAVISMMCVPWFGMRRIYLPLRDCQGRLLRSHDLWGWNGRKIYENGTRENIPDRTKCMDKITRCWEESIHSTCEESVLLEHKLPAGESFCWWGQVMKGMKSSLVPGYMVLFSFIFKKYLFIYLAAPNK